jgi:hypothetical protein
MANLTSVGISVGLPNSGTGTVSTIDALMADGGQATLGARADAKSTATDLTPVSIVSVLKQISASVQAPPAQAVTNAGTFPIQVADGADTTFGAKTDAKSTATDGTSISAMSVLKQISASLQSPPGTAVTNAGTFAVQATLAAETTKVIGTTRTLGNGGAAMDAAGQNAASPANELIVGGQFNTAPTTITSGNVSPLQLDASGNLKVNIASGASSGAVAQGSTTSGQTGGLTQAAVTTSAPAYTTAQTSPLSLDTTGNLRVKSLVTDGTNNAAVKAASTAPVATDPALVVAISPNSVNANGQTTMSASAPVVIASNQSSIPVAGDVASGSTDSGNPLKVGGIAKTANPTAVTDGQRVGALFDKSGKQVTVGAIRSLKAVQATTITSSTSPVTIVTAVASLFTDIYGLVLTNTSATGTEVVISDGTTSMSFYAPPTDTRGMMLPVDSAIPATTVNTAWTATCTTSVASLKVTAMYVKNN